MRLLVLSILLFTGVLPLAPRVAGASGSVGEGLPAFEVDLTGEASLERLGGLGLDLLEVRPGYRALVLGWPGAESLLRESGLDYVTFSRDYGRLLAERNRVLDRPREGLQGTAAGGGAVPPAGSGSLAGFWTYDEVCALLDSLAAADAAGILTGVDTLGVSVEGRPILALGVMGGGVSDGIRPEVLLTSLTHAREPGGMQTILHFLLELIEGYGTDPVTTYLVDHREIWFVPVVNPDGYVRNENTWLNTGSYGFWRKNLRDNDESGTISSVDGVDLNRNFGYEWGYDDDGSSPFIGSQTYRGPGPFSEPETQALRDFCNAHAFVVADNYHTYWEATLYPWGFQSQPTPDESFFRSLVDRRTRRNGYAYGYSEQVLYPVNGEADDWMYGETSTKGRIYAMTTEVGRQDDGFWPPASRIVPLAEANLASNVILAYAAGVYLVPDSLSFDGPGGALPIGGLSEGTLPLIHLGATGTTSGGIEVRIACSDPWVTVVDDVALYPDLGPGDSAPPLPGDGFLVSVNPAAVPGSPVDLFLEITDGAGYVGFDTLTVRLGEPIEVFFEEGTDFSRWTAVNGWGFEVVDGDSVFSDSPGADYTDFAASRLTLDVPLDLSGGSAAVVRFRTRFDIEGGYDFAMVEASADSGATWKPLAGRFTRGGYGAAGAYGGGVQPLDEPGYSGSRRDWVVEELDLDAFAGLPDVRLRFRLVSDGGVTHDGWLLDDIAVRVYGPTAPLAAENGGRTVVPTLRLPAVSPNPFSHRTRISYAVSAPTVVRVSVFDLEGRLLRVLSEGYTEAGEKSLTWDGTGADGRPVSAGAYFVRVDTGRGSASTKLLLLR